MPAITPKLKQIKSFIVTGLSAETQNVDEFNEKTAKIPTLWQQFYASGLAANTDIYGVYSDYESDAKGLYMLTVGLKSDSPKAQLSTITIEAGNYLIFSAKGSMPATVIETWKQIWAYFEKENEYQRNFMTDFEIYQGALEVAIYIGVN